MFNTDDLVIQRNCLKLELIMTLQHQVSIENDIRELKEKIRKVEDALSR